MTDSFNILNDGPTLQSPNGGEVYTEGDIVIEWKEPSNISTNELVWYELFITDDFNDNKKPDYLQIATIPSGNNSYSYYINKNLKGDKCRVGIRAVNHEGLRSEMSFSASNFIITNKVLPSPAVIQPVSGVTYFSYIPIVFDDYSITGRASQRAFYQIYYSSKNLDIDWTLIEKNIMVGTDSFDLDVSNFITSSDYILKIELVDGDNVSSPVFIDNITINNISYFVVDTLAPKGSIKIQNNEEYIKNRDLVLDLKAYDDTTAIKEFQIVQDNINENDPDVEGPYSVMSELATWDIAGFDGVKLIQARFKDYGDNIIFGGNANDFRTYKEIEGQEVTAILGYEGDVYIAFGGTSPSLYKNLTLISTLDNNATSLEYYNGLLYIATKDNENKGILQRLVSGEIVSIADNEDKYSDINDTILNSLYYSDSVINDMQVFDGKLFLGMENGTLLSFNGATIKEEYNDYFNLKSIKKIKTNGILLYIYMYNSIEMIIMYKNVNDKYLFNIVDIGI